MTPSSTGASSFADVRRSCSVRLQPDLRLPSIALVLACLCAFSSPAFAQHDHEHQSTTASSEWQWTTDASVFFGFNDQERKFRDFTAWESQNWAMAEGRRAVHQGTPQVGTMLSAEPFTIADLGSPQVFQTGETYLAEGKFDQAVAALLAVEDVYAYPQWSARALLEAGRAFEQLKQGAQASAQYALVVSKYKDTPEANLAQERLKALKNGRASAE